METMYTKLAEDYESDDGRSSAESSEGFSFASAMDLRKNLTIAFDKQVSRKASSSTMGTMCNSILSVTDRIAQFEHSTVAARPPLPVRQQNNDVPANRLAVYLRIRPPTSSEKEKDSSSELNTIDVLKPSHPNIYPTTVRTYPPIQSNMSKINLHREGHAASSCAKEFDFHQVLEPGTTQKTLYSTVATPLIQSLFDATISKDNKSTKSTCESALLFSYGITNAGKTHTILGDIKSNNEANLGVIPRTISDIFDRINQLPATSGHYDLYLSYFEIYNEQIYDLVPKKADRQKMGPPPILKVRERQGQTIVRGLAKHKVRNFNHGIELTMVATNRRHTSSNNINSGSSRSHCICQMQIVQRSPHAARAVTKPSDDDASVASMSGYSTDEEASVLARQKTSTIWIVDLAGSERSKRTGMGSTRQKEASQINKSLMTLMRCLTVMRESGRHNSSNIVPFRESKLSHVFMSHLTGSSASRTAMIVNVNPSVADFDETQHVLSYASQAKKIEINPEELNNKRKQCFGDEYGMNGRKKAKPDSCAAAATKKLVSKVAKKLSPKKMVKKFSPKKMFRGKAGKRKAAENLPTESTNPDLNEPQIKRTKEPQTNSTTCPTSGDQGKEIMSFKKALQVAQTGLELLRSEKADLVEELNQQETQIRMEVSQEMEERLRVSRERNNEELERLRSQISANPPLCRSTRKAQMDKTDQFIQELLDKVDECEEEMVRMRKAHTEEVDMLKAALEKAKTKHVSFSCDDSKVAAELRKELDATRMHMERLEKSKVELIENYEKLLKEADEGEEDDDDDDDDTENKSPQIPFWKQRILRSKTNVLAKAQSRKPLGAVSGNVSDSKADEDCVRTVKTGQWIFPKIPSAQDLSGSYKCPSGRAPHGREWDSRVGAWKVAAV